MDWTTSRPKWRERRRGEENRKENSQKHFICGYACIHTKCARYRNRKCRKQRYYNEGRGFLFLSFLNFFFIFSCGSPVRRCSMVYSSLLGDLFLAKKARKIFFFWIRLLPIKSFLKKIKKIYYLNIRIC